MTRDITTRQTEQITREAINKMLNNDVKLSMLVDQMKIRVDQRSISPTRNVEILITIIPKRFLKIRFFKC
jgi:exosome complex RNA-binding protein Rrp42 (RNase PH superfamily)